MIFESSAHNIRLRIFTSSLCKLSIINESLQTNTIENVNSMLLFYARGMRYDGGDPVKFKFIPYQEPGYISVQGDLENFIFSLKTMGYIDESLYQDIHRHLISLSQQENSIVRNFSPDNIQRMQDECSQLVAAFRQGNVRAATIHFFNVGVMSGIT